MDLYIRGAVCIWTPFMPLNRTTGEIIGDLGMDFYVAPFARWSTTPLFAEAYDRAIEAFVTSGAILPVRITAEQVLIQEYPSTNQVVFLFQAMIRNKEHLYPYVFKLEPQLVAELRTVGRWGRPH